jgi:TIR domain
MSQPLRFFVTHSSKDVEFARRLGADLRASGLGGFLDIYSIQPGDDFVARINKGLEECDVFIPILSLDALKSPWCREEINAAVALSNQPSRQGRPSIISVLVEDCAGAMPPLLQSRLHINFGQAYLSALWELLEKGFGIDPATLLRRARMYSGPRLQTGEEAGDEVWWGAYEVLEFSEADRGKTLRVTVESDYFRTPEIELWRSAFDGEDLAAWVEKRVHIARSSTPLTWNIEAGIYTVYLVDHSVFRHHIRDGPDAPGYWAYEMWPIPDYEILYRITVLSSDDSAA